MVLNYMVILLFECFKDIFAHECDGLIIVVSYMHFIASQKAFPFQGYFNRIQIRVINAYYLGCHGHSYIGLSETILLTTMKTSNIHNQILSLYVYPLQHSINLLPPFRVCFYGLFHYWIAKFGDGFWKYEIFREISIFFHLIEFC